MADKKNFDDLTPEDLERIARTIWKAKAVSDAAITSAGSGKPENAGDLLLVIGDYLQKADEQISAYI